MVRSVLWFALVSGSLWSLVRSGLWFALVSGSLWSLVRSGLWFALVSGSLSSLVCSRLWFALVSGSLWSLVRSGLWFALVSGSLWSLARSGLWFALVSGSLWSLVRSGLWFALVSGSLWSLVRSGDHIFTCATKRLHCISRPCRVHGNFVESVHHFAYGCDNIASRRVIPQIVVGPRRVIAIPGRRRRHSRHCCIHVDTFSRQRMCAYRRRSRILCGTFRRTIVMTRFGGKLFPCLSVGFNSSTKFS